MSQRTRLWVLEIYFRNFRILNVTECFWWLNPTFLQVARSLLLVPDFPSAFWTCDNKQVCVRSGSSSILTSYFFDAVRDSIIKSFCIFCASPRLSTWYPDEVCEFLRILRDQLCCWSRTTQRSLFLHFISKKMCYSDIKKNLLDATLSYKIPEGRKLSGLQYLIYWCPLQLVICQSTQWSCWSNLSFYNSMCVYFFASNHSYHFHQINVLFLSPESTAKIKIYQEFSVITAWKVLVSANSVG